MQIIHISDLHIDDPACHGEILREGFFEEYITNLKNAVYRECGKVSMVQITGDIVNRCKTDNYSHANKIIEHICKAFEIDTRDVFLTVGNHDRSRESGIQDAFESLANNYGNNNPEFEGARFKLHNRGEVWVLILDSMGDYSKKGEPKELKVGELDHITSLIRHNEVNNLVVSSHHPVESTEIINEAPFDEGKADYHAKHFWSCGSRLIQRLSENENLKGHLIWFSGDVHRPEFSITEGDINRAISSVGTLNVLPPSESNEHVSKLNPSARVVEVNNLKSSLFEYKMRGHNQTDFVGSWMKLSENSKRVSILGSTDDLAIAPDREEKQEAVKKEPSKLVAERYALFCPKLEAQISNAVRESSAYEFGIFSTNSEQSSLAWISIQKLIDHGSNNSLKNHLYSKIIREMSLAIKTTMENASEAIIVGIDTWGAILASRLSVALGVRNCCVGINTKRNSYDDFESINEKLKERISEKRQIFVVSDVLSTGKSVKTIHDLLDCDSDTKWYSLSIICDVNQKQREDLSAFEKVFYACGTIKIPILANSELPERSHQTAVISYLEEDKE